MIRRQLFVATKRMMLVAVVTLALLATAGPAFATWTATGSNARGGAKAMTLPAGSTPTAPVNTNNQIRVQWSTVTMAGNNISNYTLTRYPSTATTVGTGGTVVTCNSLTLSVSTWTCLYGEPIGGTFMYTDKPVLNNWNGGESGFSSTVAVTADSTPPSLTISAAITPTNNNKPAFSGVFGFVTGDVQTVSLAVHSGSVTGPTVATPATTNGAGHTWSTSALATGVADGTYVTVATQHDNAGNTATVSTTFVVDTVPPGTPTGSYTDSSKNAADIIGGTGEVGATITITENAPASHIFNGVVQADGTYSINVDSINGNAKTTAYSYSVTAKDAAGNTSTSPLVVSGSDTA